MCNIFPIFLDCFTAYHIGCQYLIYIPFNLLSKVSAVKF